MSALTDHDDRDDLDRLIAYNPVEIDGLGWEPMADLPALAAASRRHAESKYDVHKVNAALIQPFQTS